MARSKHQCRLSMHQRITLAEFKTLKGKMDGFNDMATTVKEFTAGTPNFRTGLYAFKGTLMTHKESIELFKKLDVKMTPELKFPTVQMPFNLFTQEQYPQKMIDDYKAASVSPHDVWATAQRAGVTYSTGMIGRLAASVFQAGSGVPSLPWPPSEPATIT
jgi:hypothetical protein